MERKAREELNFFALLFVPKNINLPRYPFFLKNWRKFSSQVAKRKWQIMRKTYTKETL